MTEAISLILGMAMFVALIAAVVGVTFGFRRKQWRLAVITGSLFGGLFIVFTIFMGATGQLEDLESEIPTQPSERPTTAPITKPSGLGISRDEVQKRLERELRDQGILFQSTESTDGTPAVIGSVDSKRMGVVLAGPEDELHQVSLLFTIAGGTHEEFRNQMDAVYLLGDLVVPEWEGRRDWLHEALAFLAEYDVADFETTQGDKHIQFAYSPSTAQALFSIELQSSDTPNPTPMGGLVEQARPSVQMESPPQPAATDGLGISRAEGQESFESIGYEFEPTASRFDGQPQSVAHGTDRNVMVVMTGSDDDLVAGLVSGDAVDAPDETAIAMALLAQTVMPDDYQSVVQWLTDTMTKITDDPARYMEKELVQTYEGRQLTFSTMSTELTGQVMFKIDSPSDPVQTTEMRPMEPEYNCDTVRRRYWLVRDMGDHQMAVMSVWDELVRTNPNADFGVDAAARAVEECGIEP